MYVTYRHNFFGIIFTASVAMCSAIKAMDGVGIKSREQAANQNKVLATQKIKLQALCEVQNPNLARMLESPEALTFAKLFFAPFFTYPDTIAIILAIDEASAKSLVEDIQAQWRKLEKPRLFDYVQVLLDRLPEDAVPGFFEFIEYALTTHKDNIGKFAEHLGNRFGTHFVNWIKKFQMRGTPQEIEQATAAITDTAKETARRLSNHVVEEGIRSCKEIAILLRVVIQKRGSPENQPILSAWSNPFIVWAKKQQEQWDQSKLTPEIIICLLSIFFHSIESTFDQFLKDNPHIIELATLFTYFYRINLDERKLLQVLSDHIKKADCENLHFESKNLGKTITLLQEFPQDVWEKFLELNPCLKAWFIPLKLAVKQAQIDALREQLREA